MAPTARSTFPAIAGTRQQRPTRPLSSWSAGSTRTAVPTPRSEMVDLPRAVFGGCPARQWRRRRGDQRDRGRRRHLDLPRALRLDRQADHRNLGRRERRGRGRIRLGQRRQRRLPRRRELAAGHGLGPQGRYLERHGDARRRRSRLGRRRLRPHRCRPLCHQAARGRRQRRCVVQRGPALHIPLGRSAQRSRPPHHHRARRGDRLGGLYEPQRDAQEPCVLRPTRWA
jgi:hypothetical protein